MGACCCKPQAAADARNRERRHPGDCVFCDMLNAGASSHDSDGRPFMYEDELVFAIHDKFPSSRGHYLVLPKAHVATVKQLQAGDLALVDHMLRVGKRLVAERFPMSSVDDVVAAPGAAGGGCEPPAAYGYHVPPWNSINHLHLHVLVPPYVPAWKAKKYQQGSFWFSTAEEVRATLLKGTIKAQ